MGQLLSSIFDIKYFKLIYRAGQKVHFGFSIQCYGKAVDSQTCPVGKDTCFSSSFATSPTLSSSGSSELLLHKDYGRVPLSLWTVADMPGIEGRLGCFWKDWKSFHSPETMAVRFEVRHENAYCFKRKAFFQICEKSGIIVTIPL